MVDEASNIAVLGHSGPDGDAMGSMLALASYLQGLGKKVTPITPNACPDFLRWLPGAEQVIFFRNKQRKGVKALEECDLVFCLDFNGLDRLEEMRRCVEHSKARRIMIDHHLDPEPMAELMVSDPRAAATCEVLFCIFHHSDQLLKGAVFANLGCFDVNGTKTIDCAAKDTIANCLINRQALTGHNRLINRSLSNQNQTVNRNGFSREDTKDISFFDLGN